MKATINGLFKYVYERQLAYYNKERLKKDPPYSDDPVIAKQKFCNNFRELDAGTRPIIKIVKDRSISNEDKLFNAIMYRRFNLRHFYSEILKTPYLKSSTFDYKKFSDKLSNYRATTDKPIFSDAYIVISPRVNKAISQDKHVQIAYAMQQLVPKLPELVKTLLSKENAHEVVRELENLPGVGSFLAGQIALDLFYSDMFKFTSDSFVTIGPGSLPTWEALNKSDMSHEDYILEIVTHQDNYLKKIHPPGSPSWRKISANCALDNDSGKISAMNMQNIGCEYRKYINLCNGEKGSVRHFRTRSESLVQLLNTKGFY